MQISFVRTCSDENMIWRGRQGMVWPWPWPWPWPCDGFYFVSDERIFLKLSTTERFDQHTAAQIFAKISPSHGGADATTKIFARKKKLRAEGPQFFFRDRYGRTGFYARNKKFVFLFKMYFLVVKNVFFIVKNVLKMWPWSAFGQHPRWTTPANPCSE